MTGSSYMPTDVKLKRTDHTKSISVADENISVRDHNVEVKSELLFLRVTCVIKDQNEMKEHIKHELGNKLPPLF